VNYQPRSGVRFNRLHFYQISFNAN
jgi:hypothetical protein